MKMTNRFDGLQHFDSVTFKISMRFAKHSKCLGRSWLRFANAQSGKTIPKCLVRL